MAKFYTFFFMDDGEEKEYRAERKTLSGAELMEIVGVPLEIGLVLLNEDGTQEFIGAEDQFIFEGPGRRFKKAPRFKRG